MPRHHSLPHHLSPVAEEHASQSNHVPRAFDAMTTDDPEASLLPRYDSLPDERRSRSHGRYSPSRYPPEERRRERCHEASVPRSHRYHSGRHPRSEPTDDTHDEVSREDIMDVRRCILLAAGCLVFQLCVTFLPDSDERIFRKTLVVLLVVPTIWILGVGICNWAGHDASREILEAVDLPFNDHILLLISCIPTTFCALNLFAPRAVWFPLDLIVSAACAAAVIAGIVWCVRAETRSAFEPVPTEEV